MGAVGFQSDSQVLVDTCLARLRAVAHLDDEPVLPKIEALPADDDEIIDVADHELVLLDCAEVKDVPSAASIVREQVAANVRGRNDTTKRSKERAQGGTVRYARWPVVLCALVATYFGLTAFLRSPLGAKPEVREIVQASRGQITAVVHGVVHTTVTTTRSFVRR